MLLNDDIAKLLLRLLVGGMMLFHGIEKIIHGISSIKYLVKNANLPEFVAYGVYIGEVVVPIFIILGIYARVASLFLSLNMIMAIFLVYGENLFSLSKHGSPVIELPLFYLILSLIIFFMGSGKYSINRN